MRNNSMKTIDIVESLLLDMDKLIFSELSEPFRLRIWSHLCVPHPLCVILAKKEKRSMTYLCPGKAGVSRNNKSYSCFILS